jgi:carboxyl-terminal processing protease
LQNGPSKRSGKIFEGDYLIEVDGQAVDGWNLKEVMKLISREHGGPVRLKFAHNDLVNEVVVQREKIILDEDRLQMELEPYLDGNIAKIKMGSFYDNFEGISALHDLKESIKQARADSPLYGVIIDMRENSGGFLHQAVQIASLFIPKGVVVIAKYKDHQIQHSQDFSPHLLFQGPLIILTSKASASAAEVVAQSLQDYGVALIVGDSHSYGKGSVQYQTITKENQSFYYKVTIGRYYTISGKSTQINGVAADIVVPTVYSSFPIGERYLRYPLSADEISSLDIEKHVSKDLRNLFLQYRMHNYSPWEHYIPQLKKNSYHRVEENKAFERISHLNKESSDSLEDVIKDMNKEDLQMKEAVNICKDLIFLHSKKEGSEKSL